MNKRPLVIVNIEANEKRAAHNWKKTEKNLKKFGIDCDVTFPKSRLESVDLVKQDKEHDIILSYSGDGGMNAVLEGAMQNDFAKIIGTLAGGTANDISKTFNLTTPDKLCSALIKKTYQITDVGEVNGKYFLGHASIGFDALALFERNQRRFIKGKLAYYPAVLRALSKYNSPEVIVEPDAEKFSKKTFMAVISNIPYYADGMAIAPQAKTDDGLLDLCLIEGKSSLSLLVKSLSFIGSQKHLENPAVYYKQFKNLELFTYEPVFLQTDGDLLLTQGNYFNFKIADKKVRMLSAELNASII